MTGAFTTKKTRALDIAPRVIAIQPTASCWPANILRAHIFFDQPMRTANAARHVSLLDRAGTDLSSGLLDLSDGLWTVDQQTLTILFHPGRVKTGLAAGDRTGPILTVGRRYQFIIDEAICGANGQCLKHSYCHYFQAGPPVAQRSLPIADKLAFTGRTVRIHTAHPLDFLSAQSHLAVTDKSGNPVPARVTVAPDGQSIVVNLPDTVEQDNYILRVHPHLEDVAGNRVSRPFEVSKHTARDTL